MTHQPRNVAGAVELLGFTGELVPDVQYAASTCAVVVQLDTEEVQRREAAGLGALASTGRHLRLLETLFDLPFDEPVPWSAISPLAQVELDCAPAGVLEHGPHRVMRLWRPAVTVSGVVVVAHDNSRRGLRRVGLHAWLPRGLVTMRRPRPSSMLPFEAAQFGIGLVVPQRPAGWELLLAPQAPRRRRFCLQQWQFLEEVYAAWRRAHELLPVYGCAQGSERPRAGQRRRVDGQLRLPLEGDR
jgi:hypothetical protein